MVKNNVNKPKRTSFKRQPRNLFVVVEGPD